MYVEYQGHDSHRNEPQQARDSLKADLCPGVYACVDKMPRYTGDACIKHLIDSFSSHPDLAKEIMKVNPKKVEETAAEILVLAGLDAGNELEEAMLSANPQHILATKKTQIVRFGSFSYICGCCGCETNAKVRSVIYRFPKGCSKCKSERAKNKTIETLAKSKRAKC